MYVCTQRYSRIRLAIVCGSKEKNLSKNIHTTSMIGRGYRANIISLTLLRTAGRKRVRDIFPAGVWTLFCRHKSVDDDDDKLSRGKFYYATNKISRSIYRCTRGEKNRRPTRAMTNIRVSCKRI